MIELVNYQLSRGREYVEANMEERLTSKHASHKQHFSYIMYLRLHRMVVNFYAFCLNFCPLLCPLYVFEKNLY